MGRSRVSSERSAICSSGSAAGPGPGGVKAVAPIGNETVMVSIPAGVTEVSLLGELLDARTSIGRETETPGRPVAVVSNVQVEYRPVK